MSPQNERRSDDSTLLIRRVDQLEALTHRVCQEIISALSAGGPQRVAALAQRLGRAPNALYRHLRRLEDADLVIADRESGQGGRPAARYRLAASRFKVDDGLPGDEIAGTYLKAARASLRASQRNLERQAEQGGIVTSGERRNTLVRRLVMELDAAGLAWLNSELDALVERALDRIPSQGDGSAINLTIVLAPEAPPKE